MALVVTRDLLLAGVAGASILAALGEGVRFGHPPFNRWLLSRINFLVKPQEHFRLTGSTYLLVASLLTFAIFPQPLALIALLFLAWGDPLAAAVGERWGNLRLGHGKSLQGSLGFVLVCLGLGLTLQPLTGLSGGVLALGAVTAALAELLTFRTDDNLTIPLVSAGSMALGGAYGL